MKVKLPLLFTTMLVVALIVGCSGNGLYVASNETNVNLGKPNFKIVATNVTGHSTAGYIIGLSMSYGAITESFALKRVSGTGRQYEKAMESFWEKFEAQYGSVEGRSLGLVNVRYDSEVLNTLFYTESTIYLTADVVEFY